MKKQKKTKTRKGSQESRTVKAPLPMGMQPTREVSKLNIQTEEEPNTYLPEETGRPDTDPTPNVDNPIGAGGLRGPLNQEGQGNRQNDELAELEEVEPDLDLDK